MARTYSRLSHVSLVSNGNNNSGNNDNTKFYVLLGILAFAIIIGTLIGSSYRSTEGFTNANKYSLIFLSMERCGHCEKFKPTWNKLMEKVNSNKTYNFDAKQTFDLNSEEGSKIAKANNITYAPAILLIENGSEKAIEYNGEREVDSIIQFAISNAK